MVDERVRFVRRLLDGESMTALCGEFGISRKTGYMIFQRYQQIGVGGLPRPGAAGPIGRRISYPRPSNR